MSITTLPNEMTYAIFSYLDPTSLFKCTHVNQLFRQIARDPKLLQELFPKEKFTLGETIIDWCLNPIHTQDQLLNYVRTFFDPLTYGTPMKLIVKSHATTSMEISLDYGVNLKEPVEKTVRLLSNVLPTHSEQFSKEKAIPRIDQWPLPNKRSAVRLTNTAVDDLQSHIMQILAEQVNTLDGRRMYSWFNAVAALVIVTMLSDIISRFF